MTNLSAAHELLALIAKQVLDEESNLREQIDRLREDDDPRNEDLAREASNRFRQSVQPLLDQRDYIITQLATIEACKPAPVMILPRP